MFGDDWGYSNVLVLGELSHPITDMSDSKPVANCIAGYTQLAPDYLTFLLPSRACGMLGHSFSLPYIQHNLPS